MVATTPQRGGNILRRGLAAALLGAAVSFSPAAVAQEEEAPAPRKGRVKTFVNGQLVEIKDPNAAAPRKVAEPETVDAASGNAFVPPPGWDGMTLGQKLKFLEDRRRNQLRETAQAQAETEPEPEPELKNGVRSTISYGRFSDPELLLGDLNIDPDRAQKIAEGQRKFSEREVDELNEGLNRAAEMIAEDKGLKKDDPIKSFFDDLFGVNDDEAEAEEESRPELPKARIQIAPATQLQPSPNIVVGRLTQVDETHQHAVLWLSTRVGALPGPVVSRDHKLEPTGVLLPTLQRDGYAYGLEIASGNPQRGDEIVVPGPQYAELVATAVSVKK